MAPTYTTGEAEHGNLVPRNFGSIVLLAVSGLLISCGGDGGASTITNGVAPNSAVLAWDISASSNVIGYRIYYGTTQGGPYSQPPWQSINVGNVTAYTVTGLTSGTTYYFTATAYDSSLNESGYSNEVSKTIP